ncbi:MAG: hypothetical protein ACJAZ1_000754 [Yoonia sp.]|jgi:hypothetical protein
MPQAWNLNGSWTYPAACGGDLKITLPKTADALTGSHSSVRSPGLKCRRHRSFNIAKYNIFSCPWHNNLTAAVASFHTAKALRHNQLNLRGTRSSFWTWA